MKEGWEFLSAGDPVSMFQRRILGIFLICSSYEDHTLAIDTLTKMKRLRRLSHSRLRAMEFSVSSRYTLHWYDADGLSMKESWQS